MENVARAWDGTVDWSDRFWSKVHPEALSGCWLWHGNVKLTESQIDRILAILEEVQS